jgi:hypothetical protein
VDQLDPDTYARILRDVRRELKMPRDARLLTA